MARKVFWVSFRIEKDQGYQRRYDDLEEVARLLSGPQGRWWRDTTSFLMFSADSTLDSVAAAVKEAIDPETDVALIGMIDYKGGRVVGAIEDQDIFTLAPLMKKA